MSVEDLGRRAKCDLCGKTAEMQFWNPVYIGWTAVEVAVSSGVSGKLTLELCDECWPNVNRKNLIQRILKWMNLN